MVLLSLQHIVDRCLFCRCVEGFSGAPVCLILSSVCQSETRAHSVASRCRVPSLSEESEHGDEDKPSLSKSTQLLMKQVCVSGVSGRHNLRDSVCRSCTSLLIVSDSVLL